MKLMGFQGLELNVIEIDMITNVFSCQIKSAVTILRRSI